MAKSSGWTTPLANHRGLRVFPDPQGGDPPAVHPPGSLAITFFSAARVWGGAEEQTRLLALGLRDRGHVCRFVVRRGGRVAQRIRNEGFPVLTLPRTGRDPLSIWRARWHLLETRPDVVHFVDPHAVTCGGLAAWRLRIPARVAVRHNTFTLRWPIRYRLLCDRIICVCQAVADVCRASAIPDSMLRIVSNGSVPSSGWRESRVVLRDRFGLPQDAPVVVTVGLLNACKGHRYLLDAWPQAVRDFPHARLALVGDGPLEEELRCRARALAIERQVMFLGFRPDARDWMRAADLLVLPSLSEGAPATVLEAMFEGCPVVTTDVGGMRELLAQDPAEREPLGWIVSPANAGALAATVREALAGADQRASRAQRARKHAQLRYTVDRMVSNTLSVYRELLGEELLGEGERLSLQRAA